ncbi:ATP-binding cassette domain-containing protein [Candidatus Saccharibacteria bacterium]|nr:ATP-binding cassette domain-containing protein [Candidatus Saccharibacteria bacterium]
MITAKHLAKRFKNKLAVDDLTFTVETGKVTGFLGPNGAGKSTTMRLMLGLDAGRGTTTFDGKPLNSYAKPAHMVGILLEAKAFHPTRSARNHLRILATAGGVPQARVDEVLRIVGLHDVAKAKPGKFSLGMSQRLGIAAAILGKPKFLMLDEPANGLDPEGIAWLRQFLKDYADQGNAVFVSSHLLSEMALMADNVVVIGKGKLIAETSISDLVNGSGRSSVFVRVTHPDRFGASLTKAKISFDRVDGGFKISGQTTDTIGRLAFADQLTILELANHKASLEDAFFELTAGTTEFSGDGGAKS